VVVPSVVGSHNGAKLWVGGSRARVPSVDFVLNVQCRPIKGERHFPLRDSGSERPERIAAAVKLLDSLLRRSDRGVYLHCAAGRSRSVVVAALWLALVHRYSLRRALSMVKRRHPSANPNPALISVAIAAMKALH
jgi:dual specificity protein phosphatase-like protein